MDTEPTKRNTLPIKIAVIALVILAYVGITIYAKNGKEIVNENSVSNSLPNQQNNSLNTNKYQDGTYTAMGKYNTPAGPEEVTVTVTLAKGVVTATNATAIAKAPASDKFQKDFIAAYPSVVVGKSIDEVSIDKIAGSSLTPKGFKEAVEQIKSQAKNS